MPRTPEISPVFLLLELKKWPDIFDEAGSLKVKTCDIWKKIQKSLKLRMLPQSLYLFLYKDKKLIEELKHYFKNKKCIENKFLSDLDPNYIPNFEMKNPYNCQTLEFYIKLTRNVIVQCLKTKQKKEGWTDYIRHQIWDSKNLPYPYSLNGFITSKQFKFFGKCSDCKTDIRGESDNLDDILKIRVTTFETYDIPHSKKLKLQGQRRHHIKQILCHQTVGSYRKAELEKVTTDYEPPNLNNSITLRKVREEALDEMIGYEKYKGSSITNKQFLNHCSVRKLSVKPFYVIYFSDNQLELWNRIQSQMLPLSFDATGSLVKKYTFYTGIKSKTLFYYALVVGIAGKIIPIIQAISSIHHVPIIEEILDRWLESGAKVPKEITSDGSLALQNAICLSFNQMTFKQYNTECFEILMNRKTQLPNCYYRHDVAHLLKAVADWKCLKQVNDVVRQFFLRSIGYLTQVDSLYKFVDILTSIIVIAYSSLAIEGTKPYESILKLSQLFKTYKHELDELEAVIISNHLDKETKIAEVESNMESNTNISLFVDNLFSETLAECTNNDTLSDRANFYYCPDFIKSLKGLCYTFPSWTNCMKSYFHSPNFVGTSCRSETNFKLLKSRIPHPLTVQKFILKDCKRNASLVKVGFMNLKQKKIKLKRMRVYSI